MLCLQLVGGLDTLPGRSELNQNAGLVNAFLLVQLSHKSVCILST